MKRGHCILAAGLCILAGLVSGCGDKKQQTSEEITTAEDGTVAVEVLDNDQIALVYNGYDPEVHGMMFTITNKSDDQMVNVYFSDVVVDGERRFSQCLDWMWKHRQVRTRFVWWIVMQHRLL